MNKIDFNYGQKVFKVAEPGFLGAIAGLAGVGKTSLTEPIISSALSGETVSGWTVDLDNKKVCVIDTESPKSIEKRYKQRILKNSGMSVEEFNKSFDYYNLSSKTSFEERAAEIENIYRNDYDFILIDNITGLCSPIDDVLAAHLFNITSKKAIETDCIVLAINHLNQKGTSRGWLGKKFSEQGSFELLLDRNEQWGYTLVFPEKTRLGRLPVWDFSIDDDKNLVLGPVIPFPI